MLPTICMESGCNVRENKERRSNDGKMGREDSQSRGYQAGCTVVAGGLSHWGPLGASEQRKLKFRVCRDSLKVMESASTVAAGCKPKNA